MKLQVAVFLFFISVVMPWDCNAIVHCINPETGKKSYSNGSCPEGYEEEMKFQVDKRSLWPDTKISIEIKDKDLHNIFRILREATGGNILVDGRLNHVLSFHFDNISVRELVRALQKKYSLHIGLIDDVILVSKTPLHGKYTTHNHHINKKATVDFYRVDIKNLFKMFKEGFGVNLGYDKNISNKVTLAGEDINIGNLINIICALYGYEVTNKNGSLYVNYQLENEIIDQSPVLSNKEHFGSKKDSAPKKRMNGRSRSSDHNYYSASQTSSTTRTNARLTMPSIGTTIVDYNEYRQIKKGMSYQKVIRIIGVAGEEMARNRIDEVPGVMESIETVMYQWVNESGSNMNALFQNNKLVQKAQFGLP